VEEVLRIAVAQPAVVAYDVAANVATHAKIVRTAGAKLVVFPELSLTGYNLDAPVLTCDDPRLLQIVAACADADAVALVSAPLADADGHAYIATLLVDGEGVTVAYRKIHLHSPEDERFTPGDKHVVLDLDGRRLGLAICRDASLAEHAAATVAAGADIYVCEHPQLACGPARCADARACDYAPDACGAVLRRGPGRAAADCGWLRILGAGRYGHRTGRRHAG
jgi:predicted amidohydrolase